MTAILIVNSGSSSLKYQLIEIESERMLAKGLLERIGQAQGVATHTTPDGEWTMEPALPDHAPRSRR